MILSEKKLRRVIREEFERFMEAPQPQPDATVLHAETGADVIFPNPIREMFDAGEVKSLADIT